MLTLQFYIDYLKDKNSGQYDDEKDLTTKAQQVKKVVDDLGVPDALVRLLLHRAIGEDLQGAVFDDQTPLRSELLDFTLLAKANNGTWTTDLVTYLEKNEDTDTVTPEMFFQDVVVPTLQPSSRSADVTVPDPIVYRQAPRIRRTGTQLKIDGGKFGVIAAVAGRPGPEDSLPTFQFLQFASSDRTATYDDGSTTTKKFNDLYDIDTENPVQMKEPGAYITVSHTDAPRWSVALKLGKAALTEVKVTDTYTTHLVRRLKPRSYEILWTIQWTFAVTWDSGKGSAEYGVVSTAKESSTLTLAAELVRANGVKEETIRAT